MLKVSYSDIFGLAHEGGCGEGVGQGDLVKTGSNSGPYFRVLAVHAHQAWLRNVETGTDGIVDLSRCRRVDGATAAHA